MPNINKIATSGAVQQHFALLSNKINKKIRIKKLDLLVFDIYKPVILFYVYFEKKNMDISLMFSYLYSHFYNLNIIKEDMQHAI